MGRCFVWFLVLVSVFSIGLSNVSNIRAGVVKTPDCSPDAQPPLLWRFDIHSYNVNGKSSWLYDGRSYPIEIQTSTNIYDSVLRFELKAVDTFNIELQMNSDGSYRTTSHRKISSGSGSSDELSSQKRMTAILSMVTNFRVDPFGHSFTVYHNDDRVTFTRVYEEDRVVDTGSVVDTRYIVPETYFQGGHFKQLYSGPAFPMKVDLLHTDRSRMVVTLKGLNVYAYDISYNKADGWVSSVKLLHESNDGGNAEQVAAEAKVKAIIAKVQQVAFEKDGRIQFITDNGSTRVSFDPQTQQTITPAPAPASEKPTPSQSSSLDVVAVSYFNRGRFENLFHSSPFPISITYEKRYGTSLIVTLNAVNVHVYELVYNSADGWVTNVKPLSVVAAGGSPDMVAVENKIKHIIANARQILFESDGRIQFIADSGNSRIAFAPRVPAMAAAGGEVRYLAADSYFVDGRCERLFSDSPFPMILSSERRIGNSLVVTLNGIKSFFKYELILNGADGWVNQVKVVSESQLGANAADLIAETKVKNIIANCQRVAFEKDGRIQFITNGGNSRVSFVLAA